MMGLRGPQIMERQSYGPYGMQEINFYLEKFLKLENEHKNKNHITNEQWRHQATIFILSTTELKHIILPNKRI